MLWEGGASYVGDNKNGTEVSLPLKQCLCWLSTIGEGGLEGTEAFEKGIWALPHVVQWGSN